MGNFSIALSGLQASTTALNTIGNNLANIDTTAYKEMRTTFEDLFYQQIGSTGSGDPLQTGAGVRVNGTASDFTQGSNLPTQKSTDMALNGNGFFIVNENGSQQLTRAGDFQLSLGGELQTADGSPVMGYPAKNGAPDNNAGLGTINLPVGATQQAQATQNVAITANLDASATAGTQATTPVKVYDSLGKSYDATITYTKTASNQWSYTVSMPTNAATGTPSASASGTLSFDSDGNLTSPTGAITGIGFPGLADGASDLSFNLSFYDPNGNPTLSQTTAPSSNGSTIQDGFASGTYTGFTVDSNGVVTASFDNNNKEVVGQVAVATVTNTDGLQRVGSNNYITTSASGDAVVGVAGAGGRASIEDFSLEQSNVDISSEFANLIIAQRSFEANSKTLTTYDSVTQAALALVR